MNKKGKLLFIGLVAALVLIVSLFFPQMQTTVSAAGVSQTTLTINHKELYDKLMENCFAPEIWANKGALISKDDENQKITLDMEKVKIIEIKRIDMTKGNSLDVLKKLISGCSRLENLELRDCDLTGFDFKSLNEKKGLTRLYLVGTKLTMVPNIKLEKLETLYLSKNNLSASGACDRITKTNFPDLKSLWLDECELKTVPNIKLGNLKSLYLSKNNLSANGACDTITGANFPNLEYLWLDDCGISNIDFIKNTGGG